MIVMRYENTMDALRAAVQFMDAALDGTMFDLSQWGDRFVVTELRDPDGEAPITGGDYSAHFQIAPSGSRTGYETFAPQPRREMRVVRSTGD